MLHKFIQPDRTISHADQNILDLNYMTIGNYAKDLIDFDFVELLRFASSVLR